jgi:hypothetical protein
MGSALQQERSQQAGNQVQRGELGGGAHPARLHSVSIANVSTANPDLSSTKLILPVEGATA